MSVIHSPDRASAASGEFLNLSKHASSILAGQLATMAFGVTDTIICGRYSDASLAALSVGAAIYMSLFIGLMGVLSVLLPQWAELIGARKQQQLGGSFRQSLYLCLCLSLTGVAVLLHPGNILKWGDVPEAMQAQVQAYLSILALALGPALWFRLFSTLNQSLGKPMLVTWLQIGSLALKVPLSIWWCFGGWGLDGAGLAGCAWATLTVQLVLGMVAVLLLKIHPIYQPLRLFQTWDAPHWPTLGNFLKHGLPSGMTVLVEITSFTLMALFIARMGTLSSASHQVASNLSALLYMVPLAIGIATSARTSYWMGANNPAMAQKNIAIGLKLVLVLALLGTCLLFLFRGHLAALYAANPDVQAMASELLSWVALFHLFDGLQALAIFVLRCFKVAILPFVIYAVLLWGLGLFGGYELAYEGFAGLAPMASPVAFWIAASVALALAGTIFWAMIAVLMKERLNLKA
jgi:MATE family multidrug resistance protein